ncbi:unnamed protein product [Urochloa decumbens]|uniref:Uncharacterized protein n=1 Tax=Urochloa decumbens TaxID=240449 RepID=A0ABC8ZNS6_9POAL
MEGLLPFLYRAILHLASGGETPLGNPFRNESPSESPLAPYYVRLAGAGAGAADVPAFLSSSTARGYYDRG